MKLQTVQPKSLRASDVNERTRDEINARKQAIIERGKNYIPPTDEAIRAISEIGRHFTANRKAETKKYWQRQTTKILNK